MKLMPYISRLIFFTCMVSISSPLFALNLMDVYRLALENDPIFKAGLKEYEAGLQNDPIGRAAILPKLVASYNQAHNRAQQQGAAYSGGPQVMSGYQYTSNYSYLQLTQPLFSLEAMARRRQGAAQANMSRQKLIIHNQNLLIRAMEAYSDLLFAKDQEKFLNAERDALYQQWMGAQKMVRFGESSKIDVLEADASYRVSEVKVLEAGDGIQLAKRKLEALIGVNIKSIEDVAELNQKKITTIEIKQDVKDLIRIAQESNPELKSAEFGMEAARQEYLKNDAAHYPTINLVAATTTQESNTPVSIAQKTDQNYLGLQLSIPIFSGGEISGRSSQAYLNYEKAQLDYRILKNQIDIDIQRFFDTVNTSKRKIEALQIAMSSAIELEKSLQRSVKLGEKSNTELLFVRKGLLSVKKELALARYTQINAYLRLHQYLGDLSLEHFQKIAYYF